MPDEIEVVVTGDNPPPPENPPSDLTALVRTLVESNQALVLTVGEMKGEIVTLRDKAYSAEQRAESAESSAAVATDIANSAANIALDTAVAVSTEAEEEEEEEEEEEGELLENPPGEIAIVETPSGDPVAVVTEQTPAAVASDIQPEVRKEKRARYFV